MTKHIQRFEEYIPPKGTMGEWADGVKTMLDDLAEQIERQGEELVAHRKVLDGHMALISQLGDIVKLHAKSLNVVANVLPLSRENWGTDTGSWPEGQNQSPNQGENRTPYQGENTTNPDNNHST